jgi:single-strand DNA-binding protein
MNETTITVTGHLTADVELRFTQSGTAVANFTVATNPRRFDKATNGYVDGEPLFLRCTAWKQLAENTAESFRRGDRVIVAGALRTNSYETSAGEKRSSIELTATEVGASVLFARVKVTKLTRTSTGGGADSPAKGYGYADDEPPF